MHIRQAGPRIVRPPQPIRQPGGYFDHEGNWRPSVAWSPPEPTAAERARASMDGAGYDPEFVETVVGAIEAQSGYTPSHYAEIASPATDYRPSRPIGVRVVICAVLVFVVLAGICAVVMGPMT